MSSKLEISYTVSDLLIQEESLKFETFDFFMADRIGRYIIRASQDALNKPIGIRMVFQRCVVYQVLMDFEKEISWFLRKENTVMETGNSSLLAAKLHMENESYAHLANNREYALFGGGFPIRVNDILCGTIAVSGLDHEADHRLIVEAIKYSIQKY